MVTKISMKCMSVGFDEKEARCAVTMTGNGTVLSFFEKNAQSNYIVGKHYDITIEPQNG